MNTIIALVVVSLATFRITKLVTEDMIFNRIRYWILIRFPSESDLYLWGKRDTSHKWWSKSAFTMRTMEDPYRKSTFIGRLISCDLCVSMWITPIAYYVYTKIPVLVLLFAIAASVYLLAEHASKDDY